MTLNLSGSWWQYGSALVMVPLACLLTLYVPAFQSTPFPLALAAVAFSTFFGGLGPGLLATALATFAINYFFTRPVSSFAVGVEETARLGAFVLTAVLINAVRAARERADATVRTVEARQRAIVEAALDAIITIDHAGNVVEFNPTAERLFGYRRAEALGQELAELIIPPGQRGRHRHGLARYRETGQGSMAGRRVELTAMRKDGSEFPVEVVITRLPSEGPPLFAGYVRDISERKRVEEAERSAETLRSVTRLANATAHEINNPLAALVLNLDLLAHQIGEEPALRSRVDRTQEAVRTIEHIVSRMGHITRLEMMQQPPDLPETLDLFKSTVTPDQPERA